MRKYIVLLTLAASFSVPAVSAQTAQTKPAAQAPAKKTYAADEGALVVRTDARQIAVGAALLVAGYGGAPTDPDAAALRERTKTGLAGLDPALVGQLRDFYAAHRRKGIDGKPADESSDSLRYRALAMFMNPPPSFTIATSETRIPPDVAEIVDFGPLVGALYRSPQFKAILPELERAYLGSTRLVGSQIAPTVNDILLYMRTTPIDRIEVPTLRDNVGKVVRPGMTRVRQLVVLVDPLVGGQVVAVRGDLVDAAGDVGQQRPGDRFAIFAGPLLAADEAALRVGVMRFLVAAVVERQREEVEEARARIDDLVQRSVVAKQLYAEAPLNLVTNSLVAALNARFQVHQKLLTENQAFAAVGDAYDRGEILAPHFYDRLKRFDEVGLDFAVFYPEFLRSLDPTKERKRGDEIAAARAAAATEPRPTNGNDAVASDILTADRLVTEKKFDDARPILERLLQEDQGNARALFGLAQVLENSPDPVETSKSSTEDDRIMAQEERLEAAVNLYKKAAENASSRELWLASWSHVYAGRILDFLEMRDEAVAEYQKAVKVGDVPRGAFTEAKAGVTTPYDPSTSGRRE